MSFVSKDDLSAILTNLNTKLRKKPTAVRLTQAEYDQLTSEEVHDTTKTYYITDGQGGGGYTLPVASASTLGGIKVGSGLSIDNTGVLSGGFVYEQLETNLVQDELTISIPIGSAHNISDNVYITDTYSDIADKYKALIFKVQDENNRDVCCDFITLPIDTSTNKVLRYTFVPMNEQINYDNDAFSYAISKWLCVSIIRVDNPSVVSIHDKLATTITVYEPSIRLENIKSSAVDTGTNIPIYCYGKRTAQQDVVVKVKFYGIPK